MGGQALLELSKYIKRTANSIFHLLFVHRAQQEERAGAEEHLLSQHPGQASYVLICIALL